VSTELECALRAKKKGHLHVIQITTNSKNWGDPVFLKSSADAGPILRQFHAYEHAKIAWSKDIDGYIDSLSK
jgi:hypothetical protein